MRVTSSMYYDNIYGNNESKLSKRLFDVNKQIASGIKIQYAQDDITTFMETMKLDNEMATLGQIKKSTESGQKVSNQADIILNEFDTALIRTKTLLIQASNSSQSSSSMDAIAGELRGLESHFKNLANTSINGQFLFSGSAINTKPIANDGTYMGNDKSLNAFLGSGVEQAYNISGSELFLGEESLIQRKITTNVPHNNLTTLYPDISDPSINGQEQAITPEDTISDLMGDLSSGASVSHFYLSGTQSDGSAFKKHIQMSGTESVEALLEKIGDEFGNTSAVDIVNVTMNKYGEIIVEDKMDGSSKLDFHMVGAIDFDQADGNDDADVNLIIDLDDGETNFNNIIHNYSTATNGDLYVKNFVLSPYESAANLGGLIYDKTDFTQEGAKVTSNSPQILKLDNAFAVDASKLSEVADITKGTSNTSDDTLDGTRFILAGNDSDGVAYSVAIDLIDGDSKFSLDTDGDGNFDNGTYHIRNADAGRTIADADDVTYRQLMDVMNMVVTGSIPAGNSVAEYDAAIEASDIKGATNLTHDGKIEFEDKVATDTEATISLYDSNSGDFSSAPSVLSFNANNALTISDAKTDFFSNLDEIITSVEEHKLYPDGTLSVSRNIGTENAIAMLDDLQLHFSRSHAAVGANSNTLSSSYERSTILEMSAMTLRSSVIDTDLAEASLELAQLNLNYQAMMSTVAKVSQLSLVNYL